MINLNNISISKLLIIFTLMIAISSCKKDIDGLDPATFSSNGEVFLDDFSPGLEFSAFAGSDVRGFQVVSDVVYEGNAAMRFAVPDVGDPAGSYVGGVFFVEDGRDLSGFDALTFWVKASKSAIINELGFGNDLGENKFAVTLNNLMVNTNWEKVIIPIPDATKLTQEKGLFYFSEGPEDGLGYTFWIDEVQFEKLGTLAQYEPGIQEKLDETVTAETGQNVTVGGLVETVNLPSGIDQKISIAPSYFTFTSSNTSVATINSLGVAMVLDAGSTTITAKLGNLDAVGSLTIESTGDPVLPPTAPIPTRSQDSVISLWSNVYNDVNVDTWDANYEFSNAEVEFIQVDGDDIIRYRNLNFVGIEFKNPTIDVREMTHFHMNVWTPDATNPPNNFLVLLADAGANDILGDADDTNHELTFTSPTIETGNWFTIDVPLSAFTGLTTRANLVQMVLSGSLPNVFVDNVYFYIKEAGSTAGDCTPLDPSLTSTFPIDFENCEDLSGVFEAGDGVTGYPNSNPDMNGNSSTRVYQFNKVLGSAWYSGIFHIFPSNFDMTDNKIFKMKIWSPKPNVKVRFQIEKEGGGAVTYQKTATITNANTWTELSFDFSDQPLIDGFTVYDKIVIIPDDQDNGPSDGSVYYIDDIELTSGMTGGIVPPTSPAPTPTQAPSNVISIFSDAYTDVPRDGFNFYGAAAFQQVNISGNSALKYTFVDGDGGNFQVIELGGANQIDAAAAGMTNFRFDLWFSNPVETSTSYLMKLVDFGTPNSTADINITSSSNPAIAQGMWLQYDFSFADLQSLGLQGSSNIQQVVVDLLNSGEVYIDNIYFYKEGPAGPIPPTSPAPTPTQAAADVISIYSDAYTNVPVDGFNFYGSAVFEQVSISSNNTLKYTFAEGGGGNFQVIELGGANQIDAAAAGMTNFRFDLWFPNQVEAGTNYLMKLVDFGTPNSTAEIFINPSSNPAMSQGSWLQYDFSFTDLQGLGLSGSSNIQQVVVDLLNSGEVYIDNIYFYKSSGGSDCSSPLDPSLTALPIDFENCENLTGVFEAGDGVTGFPAENPQQNGINTSSRVYQFNKVVGSAWYSGIFHIFPSNFDMTSTKVFKMKIWSPKANVIVRFQIEKEGMQGPIVTYLKTATTGAANTWTELTFDFSDQPFTSGTNVYDKFVIIPDDQDNGPADGSIYYIDDITLGN